VALVAEALVAEMALVAGIRMESEWEPRKTREQHGAGFPALGEGTGGRRRCLEWPTSQEER
jgi:hypothetical protein